MNNKFKSVCPAKSHFLIRATLLGLTSLAWAATGFVLSQGKFTSVDIPGATSTEANGLDPHGNVVGRYVTSDGYTHGYFLSKGKVD